jgi:hypothetical protein
MSSQDHEGALHRAHAFLRIVNTLVNPDWKTINFSWTFLIDPSFILPPTWMLYVAHIRYLSKVQDAVSNMVPKLETTLALRIPEFDPRANILRIRC